MRLDKMARYETLGLFLNYLKVRGNYPPHNHDYLDIEVVMEGTAVDISNGEVRTLSAGDVLVIDKGATHEISQVEGLVLYNMGFDQNAMRSMGQDLLELPGFHALFLGEENRMPAVRRLQLTAKELDRARDILEQMHREYESHEPGFRTALLSGLSQLLLLLSRSCGQQELPGIWQAAAAAARMEREYAGPVSVAELAKSVYLSERHFRRLFEQVYGVSPSVYLTELRLKAAQWLLLSRSGTVTDVAMACGFSDGNYFTRMFRRKFGVTPTAYRKLQQT